jgi:plastocyanin
MRGMKLFAMCALAFSLAVAACGGDDSPAQMDSGMGSGSGSGANKVTTVTCSGTPMKVTVVDGTDAYMPMSTTITAGSMVEFKTSVTHNVIPGLAPSDPGLTVGFSADVCLKFTTAGTYNFVCQNHGFKGTIVVN